MARILLIWTLISLQLTGCLLQEDTPTVAEYFLEAMDLLGRENWRYFMSNDTDIDQDGRVSDLEIEYKIHSYLAELFNIMDQDKDNIVTEEEMKHLKIEIPNFTEKIIDIALENFPVKPTLLAADANGDGFYDEDDFYLPAQLVWRRPETNQSTTNVRLRNDGLSEGQVPELYMDNDLDDYWSLTKIAQLGDTEGAVLCRSLGYEGVNRTIEQEEYNYGPESFLKISCQGNESRLEDCQLINLDDSRPVNYVECMGEPKLGPLHLIGGKDSSTGDIFFGEQGLGCTPYRYTGGLDKLSEVICRELGFPGFIKTTRRSSFTKNIYPEYQVLEKGFSCKGTEEKLADCEVTDGRDQDCDSRSVRGIVCKTDTKKGADEGLADIIGWNRNSDIWEKIGRFLFIADSNGDKKLTLDEIARKAKIFVSRILEFLDQTQDGHISINDLTSLNIKVEPIHKILDLAFDVVVNKTSDDIDLLALSIADISLDELVGYYLRSQDENRDGKLNALDFFASRDFKSRESKERYLITFLNMKLDKNQDGKLQRPEVKQFINEMFRQLDTDESGEITLKDVYRLMRTHGFDCFQVGALKTFVTIILDTAQSQFGKFMSYLFKQFDLDSNERVTLEEIQKMNVPCDIQRRRSYGSDGSHLGCSSMVEAFFGKVFQVRFPDLEMKSRRRNRYDDNYGRGEEDEETVVDKLTNAACEILT